MNKNPFRGSKGEAKRGGPRARLGFFAAGALLLVASYSQAVPSLVNLQGRLTDPNGNPIQTATQVEFRIFHGGDTTTADSGVMVYREIATVTPGPDGAYSYLLGSGSPIAGYHFTSAVFNSSQGIYLQLEINNQAILPRLQFASVGGAMLAGEVEDGVITNSKIASGAVNTSQLADGAVSLAKLDSGASGFLVPVGAVMLFTGNCPAGWTRFSGLDDRFPLGGPTYGSAGGSATHSHSVAPHTHSISVDGAHNHGGWTGEGNNPSNFDPNPNGDGQYVNHIHSITTDGAHSHGGATGASGSNSDSQSNLPPFLTMVFCQKS